MKTSLFSFGFLMLLTLTLASCRKNSSPPVVNETVRLKNFVITHPGNNTTRSYSYGIRYDNLSRITSVYDRATNRVQDSLQYISANTIRVRHYDGAGNLSSTFDLQISREQGTNGYIFNSIFARATGADTIREVYRFQDSLLVERLEYILPFGHNSNEAPDRDVYQHANNGNLNEALLFHSGSSTSLNLWQCRAFDTQKNYLRTVSPETFFLLVNLGTVLDVSLRSRNNVTSVEYGDGSREDFEYTYTPDGFIATAKKPGESYVGWQYEYERIQNN
jgi:hypothetical protein